MGFNLEAEVEQAWKDDAELTALKQEWSAKQSELNALARAVQKREDAIIVEVKQRFGLPERLTDFECMLEESRLGIH